MQHVDEWVYCWQHPELFDWRDDHVTPEMIVFLAYEGVIHRAGQRHSFEYMLNVERLLGIFPRLKLVLLPDWPLDYLGDDFRAPFAPHHRRRVIGAIPAMPAQSGGVVPLFPAYEAARRFLAPWKWPWHGLVLDASLSGWPRQQESEYRTIRRQWVKPAEGFDGQALSLATSMIQRIAD